MRQMNFVMFTHGPSSQNIYLDGCKHSKKKKLKMPLRAGEVTQKLKLLLSFFCNARIWILAHTELLKTTCDSSSRGSNTSSDFFGFLYTHSRDTHTHI